MSEVPVGIRYRLRELTLGPIEWGIWSLTFHDGSTYCSVAYDGKESPENAVGWAALTFQYDVLPMVGVYVGDGARGKGMGALLLTTLLQSLQADEVLKVGDTVVASTWRWDRYEEVCAACNITCQTWE